MGATSSEGTGPGAVNNILPSVFNGVVKSTNIAPNQVLVSDLADSAVTTAKINDSAVTTDKLATKAAILSKIGNIAGGLKFADEVVSIHYIKARATFNDSPDRTTLEIAANEPNNALNLKVAYTVVAATGFDSDVLSFDPAPYNTFNTIATVNGEGDLVEAYVMDQSFHNTYRITMQVRQSNNGMVHLVIEHIMNDGE